MKDEALKLALEALETCEVAWPGTRFKSKYFAEDEVKAAITAIKQALAAPVQEPVAIGWDTKTDTPIMGYTTPPAAQRQWVGLTDEERDDVLDIYITAEGRARAIEAKLKEKNT
jgi:hypothetical protein